MDEEGNSRAWRTANLDLQNENALLRLRSAKLVLHRPRERGRKTGPRSGQNTRERIMSGFLGGLTPANSADLAAAAAQNATSDKVAAGDSLATATLLDAGYSNVTGADGTKGVRMSTIRRQVVFNDDSENNLLVYPNTVEQAIDGGDDGQPSAVQPGSWGEFFYRNLLALLLIVSLASNAFATTYYVRSTAAGDTGGNDGSADSDDKAFKTVAKGVSVLAAGDTLNIKSGTYLNETSGGGFLLIPPYASATTIQGTAGNPTKPIISSLLDAGSVNVQFGDSGTSDNAHLTITGLQFSVPAGKVVTCGTFRSMGFSFVDCVFTANPHTSPGIHVVDGGWYTSAGQSLSFSGCSFLATPTTVTDCVDGIYFTPTNGRILASLTLTDCTISVPGQAITLASSTAGDIRNVTIDGCTVTTLTPLGATLADRHAIELTNVNREGLDTITITDTTVISPLIALYALKTTGFVVDNCKFIGKDQAMLLGSDGYSVDGTVNDGVFTDCLFKCAHNSTGGHTVFVGWTCEDIMLDGCTVDGGIHAVVFKGSTDCTLQNSTVLHDSNATNLTAVYVKGTTGTNVLNNTIIAGYGACVCIDTDNETAFGQGYKKATDVTVTGNTLISEGTASACWKIAPTSGATDFDGFIRCDKNRFVVTRGNFGWFGPSATAATSYSGVRKAWKALSVDYSTNDSNSIDLNDPHWHVTQ
jgi:hypothetical protein